jgi:hypothetical protein
MPELEYFIVSRSVSRDVLTDELSFLGVLEDVTPHHFPTVLPKIIAVSVWRLADGEGTEDFQAILRVSRPEESPQDATDFAMNLEKGRTRYRAFQAIFEIPLDRSGNLVFEVLLNAKHAALHIVTIHDAKPGTDDSGDEMNLELC